MHWATPGAAAAQGSESSSEFWVWERCEDTGVTIISLIVTLTSFIARGHKVRTVECTAMQVSTSVQQRLVGTGIIMKVGGQGPTHTSTAATATSFTHTSCSRRDIHLKPCLCQCWPVEWVSGWRCSLSAHVDDCTAVLVVGDVCDEANGARPITPARECRVPHLEGQWWCHPHA